MAFNVPINRMTGRPAQTPYAVGYDTGSAGHCFYSVHYSKADHRDEYRSGWIRGYREALTREVQEYNERNGTTWEPRL